MRNTNALHEINSKLVAMDIKGKNYVTVNERIKAFWELFPNGRIYTSITTMENGFVVMRAEAYEEKEDAEPIATGTAYEKENTTYINKVSYIENCETSAIGRCLGVLGIGIDTSVASFDEVKSSIDQQAKINTNKVQALVHSIENNNIDEQNVNYVLAQFGYDKVEDICVVDYKPICDELKKYKGV